MKNYFVLLTSAFFAFILFPLPVVFGAEVLTQTTEDFDQPVYSGEGQSITQTFSCSDIDGTIDSITVKGAGNGFNSSTIDIQLETNDGTETVQHVIPSYSSQSGYAEQDIIFNDNLECTTGIATTTFTYVTGQIGYLRVATSENEYTGGEATCYETCGDLYFKVFASEVVTETPTGGTSISTTTIEWIIASTTESLYAVGYSINLYLGIFFFLIFTYLGFRFIRIFV